MPIIYFILGVFVAITLILTIKRIKKYYEMNKMIEEMRLRHIRKNIAMETYREQRLIDSFVVKKNSNP